MSEKTLIARIEEDLEHALVEQAEAEKQVAIMERDYNAALKVEVEAVDMAMRLRRSLLIMQGVSGSTAWQQAQVRNRERIAEIKAGRP